MAKNRVSIAHRRAAINIRMQISANHIRLVFFLLIFPLIFLLNIFLEMTFAEPGGVYRVEPNKTVRCEALVAPIKSWHKPRCASFGSMETNPGGYALLVVSLLSLGGFGWATSRPRCEIRF